MPETLTAGIFQVAFSARQMKQTPRAFFQTTFEPIGRVCVARHARGGLGLQGKWRTRAYRTHPTCRLLHNLFSLQQPLTPTAARHLSRGRELERGQQAARLVLGRLRCLGKIAAIRGMPSPQPFPTGEGAGCSGFRRCRSSEKECPKHQRREFFR